MNEKRSISINQFVLRIIAIITMTLDHIGVFLMTYPLSSGQFFTGEVFRLIGRIAFPLFALMLAEGMRHTRSKEKYLLRIFGIYLAITVAQTIINYGLANHYDVKANFPNPFTDLILNGLVLCCLSKKKYFKFFVIIPITIICLGYGCDIVESLYNRTVLWFPVIYRSSYGVYGLLITLGFYYAVPLAKLLINNLNERNNLESGVVFDERMERRLINILSCLIFFVINVLFFALKYYPEIGPNLDVLGMSGRLPHLGGFQSYALLAIIPIFFYNGKRGYDSKFFRIFSYLYFPVHLIIIFLIFTYAV